MIFYKKKGIFPDDLAETFPEEIFMRLRKWQKSLRVRQTFLHGFRNFLGIIKKMLFVFLLNMGKAKSAFAHGSYISNFAYTGQHYFLLPYLFEKLKWRP